MGRFVTVHKAAALVGITPRDIQCEIDNGRLPSVRGMVQATEKLTHELTKTELRKLLNKANMELTYQRDKIDSYEHLINELRYSLQVLKEKSSEPNKIQSLIAWIDKKVSK